KAKSAKELERVAEFVAHWHFWPVLLSCPEFSRVLLRRVKEANESIHKAIFGRLRGLPGSRGGSACEPDAEWKSLAEAVEKMAQQYKEDPELGPLYDAAAKNEREWMKSMQRRSPEDEDIWED